MHTESAVFTTGMFIAGKLGPYFHMHLMYKVDLEYISITANELGTSRFYILERWSSNVTPAMELGDSPTASKILDEVTLLGLFHLKNNKLLPPSEMKKTNGLGKRTSKQLLAP